MKGPDLRVTIWALWFSPREWAGYKSQGTQVNEAWGQDWVHEKKKKEKKVLPPNSDWEKLKAQGIEGQALPHLIQTSSHCNNPYARCFLSQKLGGGNGK